MSSFREFVKGILGGICIGIAGTAFLLVEDRVPAAFFFSLGLCVICSLGFNLFTGKVCYVLENDGRYLLNVGLIWLGNLCGTFLTGTLLRLTRIAPALSEKAGAVVSAKLSDSPLSLFILGAFCNMLIYFGVEGYRTIQSGTGRYLVLSMCVMVFALCGFEHSVAGMYYFSAAGAWSAKALPVILVITLGNAAGGILIPALKKYLKF